MRFAAEIGVVVLTAGVLWITNRQATIMTDQNTIMGEQNRLTKKLFEMSERAHIEVGPITRNTPWEPSIEMEYIINYQNLGKMLAASLRIGAAATVVTGPDFPDGPPRGELNYTFMALASAGVKARAVSLPPLTPVEHERVTNGARRIYIWGIVEYDDGFGNRRSTRFCYIHAPAVGHRTERFAFCLSGNDAT